MNLLIAENGVFKFRKKSMYKKLPKMTAKIYQTRK